MSDVRRNDDKDDYIGEAQRLGYGYLHDGSSPTSWPAPSRWTKAALNSAGGRIASSMTSAGGRIATSTTSAGGRIASSVTLAGGHIASSTTSAGSQSKSKWKVPSIPSQLVPRNADDSNGIFVSVDWSEETINAADIEREIAVTLDSGAVDHVISTELLPAQTEICEVTGSRVGKRLVAANGQPMQTFGECILECEDGTGKSAASFAVTEVSRALQSVSRICDQDLEVLFTKTEAKIRDPKTGKFIARYARKGGLYTPMVRVRPGSKPDPSARPRPAASGGGRRPGPFTRPSKKP